MAHPFIILDYRSMLIPYAAQLAAHYPFYIRSIRVPNGAEIYSQKRFQHLPLSHEKISLCS